MLSLFFRCHIISQFNQGFYDYIIATDEHGLENQASSSQKSQEKRKKKKAGKSGKYGLLSTKYLTAMKNTSYNLTWNVIVWS